MPNLKVNGKSIQVENGTRLVLAIENAGIKIGHRCGGFANCTTCRVEIIEGEPASMTKAEYQRLKESGLFGKARLSCQIICEKDMHVQALVTAEQRPDWEGDTGPAPQLEVTPAAEWFPVDELG